ncbi:MAG: spermidine synthase [Legionellales bacterium]|mgnify:CR=1 FL=1|nr:spermidine synthase [Legionellales bacterium]|tara:strand:+ start:422 stop:1282 length:861 start_codon:yes stop_codon:yes gene_type:complete
MSQWHHEILHDSYRQSFESETLLFDTCSEHQRIQIFETPLWGRVMLLDQIVQTTERDEFIYHEMFAHVPCFAHGAPRSVLIIGGGDGGLLREVLKHAGIERVVLVEIDAEVIELCKTYLPQHSQGAFSDPRVEVVIADGAAYLDTTSTTFDLILSDSTDPIGPGEVLFEQSFYQKALNHLNPKGILVTQNGVSFLQLGELRTTHQRLSRCAQYHGFYQAVVPTYIGGAMHFAWASPSAPCDQVTVESLASRFEAAQIKTRYYHPALHAASFVLPQYVNEACIRSTS